MSPWNKGLKGYKPAGSDVSRFKKGHRMHAVAVGTVTVRTDKNGAKRRWVKIAEPRTWEIYSTWLWQQEHGPIPPGLFVHHLDGYIELAKRRCGAITPGLQLA
jgi:hypothetical protein